MDQLNEMRMKVGFLFQEGALYDLPDHCGERRFLLLTPRFDSERNEKVRALLSSVGGLDRRIWKKMPSDISGGMRKRVGLARALP